MTQRLLAAALACGGCVGAPGAIVVRSDAEGVAPPSDLYGVFAPSTVASSVDGLLPAAVLSLLPSDQPCALLEEGAERAGNVDWQDEADVQAWWEGELQYADTGAWSVTVFLERAPDVGEAWQVAEGPAAYRSGSVARRTAPYPAVYADYLAEDPRKGWDAWRAFQIHVDRFEHEGADDGLRFDLTLDELIDEEGDRVPGTVHLVGEAEPCNVFRAAPG